MGNERNPRDDGRPGDYYNRGRGQERSQDQGRDGWTSRDYAVGGYGDRDTGRDRDAYGSRDYYGGGRDEQSPRSREAYGSRDYGRDIYGNREQYGAREQSGYRPYDQDRGSYGADGRRFIEAGRGNNDRNQLERGRGFSGQPQGYDYDDRGFVNRAGDEVRSWFGDDEAERRREMDRKFDERSGHGAHDQHYGDWRRKQMSELDRDYHEYRQENSSKFENEFNTFRTERQTQRSSLSRVKEHMEVVGSDGEHVGTVDKIRGDRILLTKSDKDAGGHHHSIPSRWIDAIDDKVKIRKTAEEAQRLWRDEEDNEAMFGDKAEQTRTRPTYGASNYGSPTGAAAPTHDGADAKPRDDLGGKNLNRSFSGTY